MRMIILEPDEAAFVKGPYGESDFIDPIPYGLDYMLPADIIDNPAFESVKEFLQQLPQYNYEP